MDQSYYQSFFDRFISSVPVEQYDDAEQFVKEIKFMCSDFLNTCPVTLHRSVPTDKQPKSFFQVKNRHRSLNEAGVMLNAALQTTGAFERGVDLSVKVAEQDNCVVFLPDRFSIIHSSSSFATFLEAAQLVNPADLGSMVYQHSVSTLTESAEFVIASNIPFYYCIRL